MISSRLWLIEYQRNLLRILTPSLEILACTQRKRPFIMLLSQIALNSNHMPLVRNYGCTNSTRDTYEEAVKVLNTLQSNSKTLKSWSQSKAIPENVLADTIRYLQNGGVTIEQMNSLNVIHVAGTKGKGTTCAFVESILRHAGLRTGFFSSPHLVAVRERIRIDGKPISKDKFAKYFFQVYRNMELHREFDDDMPAYFRFLTCMAFYTFYSEKLDVVILEVGIGGSMDPTNVVRKPIVTGITSLGLEHQSVLGNTLEEITLAKAGIMKEGVPCFTIPTHTAHILQLLREHAAKVNCPLVLTPNLRSYEKVPELIDNSPVTLLNASIAIQLANTFMQQKFPERLIGSSRIGIGHSFSLLPWHRDGLRNCVWPGRFQILRKNPRLTFFLDGAHTVESLGIAQDWFMRSTKDLSAIRILVFNVTGDRNPEQLLSPFATVDHFHSAIFCPILALSVGSGVCSHNNWSALQSEQKSVMESSVKLGSIWNQQHLSSSEHKACVILPSVNDVLNYLDKISIEKRVQVLVTGSLHLVGAFLTLLDPELTSCPTHAAHKFHFTKEQ